MSYKAQRKNKMPVGESNNDSFVTINIREIRREIKSRLDVINDKIQEANVHNQMIYDRIDDTVKKAAREYSQKVYKVITTMSEMLHNEHITTEHQQNIKQMIHDGWYLCDVEVNKSYGYIQYLSLPWWKRIFSNYSDDKKQVTLKYKELPKPPSLSNGLYINACLYIERGRIIDDIVDYFCETEYEYLSVHSGMIKINLSNINRYEGKLNRWFHLGTVNDFTYDKIYQYTGKRRLLAVDIYSEEELKSTEVLFREHDKMEQLLYKLPQDQDEIHVSNDLYRKLQKYQPEVKSSK